MATWRRFLSHLSGDEGTLNLSATYTAFLSHLSGDEVRHPRQCPPLLFLSHLSGDEEVQHFHHSNIKISKSPKR